MDCKKNSPIIYIGKKIKKNVKNRKNSPLRF